MNFGICHVAMPFSESMDHASNRILLGKEISESPLHPLQAIVRRRNCASSARPFFDLELFVLGIIGQAMNVVYKMLLEGDPKRFSKLFFRFEIGETQ